MSSPPDTTNTVGRSASDLDLDSPEAIDEMVRTFYGRVAVDELLGPVFVDVARVDWDEHLPKLSAFWARALLGRQGYAGNPFRQHAAVHDRSPFTHAHFDRWLLLFRDTVETGWSGPHAERALELAANVARVHREQLIGEQTVPAVQTVPVVQTVPGTLGGSGIDG